MSKNYINDLEHAYLLLIKEEQFTQYGSKAVDNLYNLGLIQMRPNSAKFMLTIKGEEVLRSNYIKKESFSDESFSDYNSVLQMMSDSQINALFCAAMNERVFEKIPKNTARVLGQHLLDTKFYFKFGSVLTEKYIKSLNKSLEYFKNITDERG